VTFKGERNSLLARYCGGDRRGLLGCIKGSIKDEMERIRIAMPT
jgi:hypothetical protein